MRRVNDAGSSFPKWREGPIGAWVRARSCKQGITYRHCPSRWKSCVVLWVNRRVGREPLASGVMMIPCAASSTCGRCWQARDARRGRRHSRDRVPSVAGPAAEGASYSDTHCRASARCGPLAQSVFALRRLGSPSTRRSLLAPHQEHALQSLAGRLIRAVLPPSPGQHERAMVLQVSERPYRLDAPPWPGTGPFMKTFRPGVSSGRSE